MESLLILLMLGTNRSELMNRKMGVKENVEVDASQLTLARSLRAINIMCESVLCDHLFRTLITVVSFFLLLYCIPHLYTQYVYLNFYTHANQAPLPFLGRNATFFRFLFCAMCSGGRSIFRFLIPGKTYFTRVIC